MSIAFRVVRNAEEQYSIWPADMANASGWFDEGTAGTREECLAHIAKIWTDLRPLSLRAAADRDHTAGTVRSADRISS